MTKSIHIVHTHMCVCVCVYIYEIYAYYVCFQNKPNMITYAKITIAAQFYMKARGNNNLLIRPQV